MRPLAGCRMLSAGMKVLSVGSCCGGNEHAIVLWGRSAGPTVRRAGQHKRGPWRAQQAWLNPR